MSKDDFFSQASDLQSTTITVPSLGRVVIKELTLAERFKVQLAANAPNAASGSALLVVACAYHEDGRKVFAPEDAVKIDHMPSTKASLLTIAAGKMNELTAADEDNAAKNS